MAGGALKSRSKEFFVPSTGSFVSSTGSLQKSQIDLQRGPEGLEYVHEAYTHLCFHSSPLFHHFFHVIMLLSSKLCLLQEALNFYRKHPVEPLGEPNPIPKVNLMVGAYWLGLQALVCPSLAFIHHFFSPPCASHCASTGSSSRNCGKLGMHFKKWFGEHGSFLKGSETLLPSSNSSSIISIPASQAKFILSSHASTCKMP